MGGPLPTPAQKPREVTSLAYESEMIGRFRVVFKDP